ncbi:MAG: hypothetical protein L0Y74_02560 [candidate division Zixibacteria bacterium]|nr:hypothetical protein [candidate division Zixibacteria bacterium]
MRVFKYLTFLSGAGLIYTLWRYGLGELINLTFFLVIFVLSLAGWLFGDKLKT